jgi:hypothetical protein
MNIDNNEFQDCDWHIQNKLLNDQIGTGFFLNLKKRHIAKLKSRPNNINKFMNTLGNQRMIHLKSMSNSS